MLHLNVPALRVPALQGSCILGVLHLRALALQSSFIEGLEPQGPCTSGWRTYGFSIPAVHSCTARQMRTPVGNDGVAACGSVPSQWPPIAFCRLEYIAAQGRPQPSQLQRRQGRSPLHLDVTNLPGMGGAGVDASPGVENSPQLLNSARGGRRSVWDEGYVRLFGCLSVLLPWMS